jgi:hypothetical protein
MTASETMHPGTGLRLPPLADDPQARVLRTKITGTVQNQPEATHSQTV